MMDIMKKHLLIALCSFIAAGIAYAGAPLKGVDVKLGRNPGGMAAARTTDPNGKINFGVLARGSYYITLAAPPPAPGARGAAPEPPLQTCEVSIDGVAATPYKVEWNFMMQRPSPVQPADSSMRMTMPATGPDANKILFESDGAHPVSITIVKSKSNITNN
jgi:hypothetical protein